MANLVIIESPYKAPTIKNYLGSNYFAHDGVKAVKPVMIAVLSIFFLRMVWEIFF